MSSSLRLLRDFCGLMPGVSGNGSVASRCGAMHDGADGNARSTRFGMQKLMDLGLSRKKAIVCAASKGLGRAVAIALAREGVDLVINARSQDVLKVAAAEIGAETGVNVIPIAADITTGADREAVLAACPSPDILVNNAGGTAAGRLSPGDARGMDQGD